MRTVSILCIAGLLAACTVPVTNNPSPDASQLVGRWQVDLRPTPDAPEYFQEFVVTSADGKTFQGAFYGSRVPHAGLRPGSGPPVGLFRWSAVAVPPRRTP